MDLSCNNYFKYLIDTEYDKDRCHLHPKLKENGYSCIGLFNSSINIIILSLILLIKAVINTKGIIMSYQSRAERSRGLRYLKIKTPYRIIASLFDRVAYLIDTKMIETSFIMELIKQLRVKIFAGLWISVLDMY